MSWIVLADGGSESGVMYIDRDVEKWDEASWQKREHVWRNV